jgi:uncharacterized protein YjbI with pentapeptide repeats
MVLVSPRLRDPNVWFKDSASIRDLIVSIAAIGGVPFLIWREWNTHRTASAALRQAESAARQARIAERRHQKQTEADRERRITDVFGKAVELLGKEELETRLGAIYALERIADESQRDYWPIMETLTAYVRSRHRLDSDKPTNTAAEPSDIAVDAQAVLTVISRRNRAYDKPDQRLDLRQTLLRRAHFNRANLTNANLESADLTNASLTNVNLTDANLTNANLSKADLTNANLMGSDLAYANLTDAGLRLVNLTGAIVAGADLRGANLTDANLTNANLTNANLRNANLTNANLTNANLRNADLTDAKLARVDLTDAKLEHLTNVENRSEKAGDDNPGKLLIGEEG